MSPLNSNIILFAENCNVLLLLGVLYYSLELLGSIDQNAVRELKT